MERYSDYKDSGVKWLGEIPRHWEVLPGLAVLMENKEKNTDLSENTVLSLSYGNIIVKKDIDEGLVPTEYNTYQIVHPGYIIIRCTDLQNDKVSLRTGLVKNDGIITGAYLGLIVNSEYNSSYIHYFLHSWDITKEIYRYGSGLRQSLSWLDLRRLLILLPSREEQDAIVAYLDAATSKIDEAIAQQQKMIDLLNERKQIIINNAVTKGLDPNVPMKDSGVEWIGEIPEHWEVVRFKRCATIKANLVHPKEYLSYPQISPENIEKNSGRLIGYGTVENAGIISDNHLFKKGQILYSKIRPALNKAIIAPCDGLCCADMYPIESKNNTEFMLYVILSRYFSGQVQLVVNDRVKMPKINKEELGEILVAFPDNIEEQKRIANYVEQKLEKIVKSIAQYNKQISLLKERKQIIINDVVTGKVKVV